MNLAEVEAVPMLIFWRAARPSQATVILGLRVGGRIIFETMAAIPS